MDTHDLDSLKEGLVPFFQPIVEVSTGMITAFETLARYHKPNGEISSAAFLFHDDYLPKNIQRELDQHVRMQAIRNIRSLPDNTRLTVNISPELIEFQDGVPVIRTMMMLNSENISPQKVVIELVESDGAISDLAVLVHRYREQGLRIAVDDFGSGFSHFDRVIELTPDIIKLDMRLLKKALSGGRFARVAVKSIVDFCEKSGALVVMEGVETEEEFFFGLSCGAHYMQGYLFSPAVAEFLSKDTFKDQIETLRTTYFNETRKTLRDSTRWNKHLVQTINRIKERSHVAGFIRNDIEPELKSIPNLIRYYMTDYEGNQLSPNLSLNSSAQFVDEGTPWENVNWSWRPYFCKASNARRAIVSDVYYDLHSGKSCKTIVVRLGNGEMLLVDVLVSED